MFLMEVGSENIYRIPEIILFSSESFVSSTTFCNFAWPCNFSIRPLLSLEKHKFHNACHIILMKRWRNKIIIKTLYCTDEITNTFAHSCLLRGRVLDTFSINAFFSFTSSIINTSINDGIMSPSNSVLFIRNNK